MSFKYLYSDIKDRASFIQEDTTVDTVTTTYNGYIYPDEKAPLKTSCAIQRIIYDSSTGTQEALWSNGSLECNVAWADRATLTYTHLTKILNRE